MYKLKEKLDERYNLAKYNLKKSTIRRTPQYGKLYIVNCTLQMSLHHVQYLFFDLFQLILHLHYNLLHLSMIPDAQILDPFCGVGTMLIERQKVVKGNTSYGIDHSPEAIEKAIYNTNLADQIVHYINKDCFTFTHDYPFDEIFTEMPYATGQKTEAEIREVYEKFFPFAKRVLGPEGTIIMYTRNREYIKQFAVKSNFRILKEIKITQRPESYLMILK